MSAELTRRLDVAEFVDQVRRALDDLDVEEREELTGGLEADLTERLDDIEPAGHPSSVFGSPESYADELRAAAGLAPKVASRRPRLRLADRANWLENRVDDWRERPAGAQVWAFMVAIKPVWWIARAWIALQVLDLWFGGWPHSWMLSVHGYFMGFVALAVASIVSVQIGRGAWRFGVTDPVWWRRAVLAINVLAVVGLLYAVANLPRAGYVDVRYVNQRAYSSGHTNGLVLNGHQVHNIYAYDSTGKPLLGVQLFDEDGNPIDVAPRDGSGRGVEMYYPWMSGGSARYNVFPLPSRHQRFAAIDKDAYESSSPPLIAPPAFTRAPVLDPLPAKTTQDYQRATGMTPPPGSANNEPKTPAKHHKKDQNNPGE